MGMKCLANADMCYISMMYARDGETTNDFYH